MNGIILENSIHFNEIGLMPAKVSGIKSRKDVNPFDKDGRLPVIVAPMTCLFKQ